jgi:3-hydroxyacyl-[acyl-carrier-protein] dehydratase
MRWFWIDRILLHDRGQRLVTIKNVSAAEEHLHDHFPADGDLLPQPVMPASLILEGMAQTGGILVGAANDFREKVVLAKIASAQLLAEVVPGQTLRYDATLERLDASGASCRGVVDRWDHVEAAWTRIGEIELMFSHLDQNLAGTDFPKENFVFGENFRWIIGMLAEAPSSINTAGA